MVSTWQQTDATTQTVSDYPLLIDGDVAVATRVADAFAPHEQTTPNMAVELDAGFLFDPRNASLVPVTAQSTSTITAPVSQPRIDRVVIDAATGAVSVVTGTEAASPTPPDVPLGTVPVAQVMLQTTSIAITNAMITDERAVWGSPVVGVPWAPAAGTANAITAAYKPANAGLYDGLLLSFRATAANTTTTPSFAPDGLTAYTITKEGGQALVAGDIPGNLAECVVRYNAANTRWELLNPQQGLLSVLAGTGINVSGSGGSVTIDNAGVTALTGGTAISVSGATGSVTVDNTGVTSLTAGTGVGVSSSTGGVTVSNAGVTSLTAGSGVSLSGSTGSVTINATGIVKTFSSSPVAMGAPNGTVTIPHTLGVQPLGVQLFMKCVTANAGYSPGDIVGCPMSAGETFETYFMRADTSNIYAKMGQTGIGIYNKSTNGITLVTLADWNLIANAWA